MGDFDALDELEREPTEEEIRADRAANVREYFRTKRGGEEFRPVSEERKRYVFTDTFNDFNLLPKDAFDW